ncbi:CLUMA_CG018265, isoform A [Clunio marinus]|uniref:CLUMA_CG018265, isoform A n=1 Tax=Clunio marinus TaxID=568069 RepID=A0A1J1IZR3_9DIPT|nr:CLUMA_CG018265, isoform A [Clunio marinus]
MDSRKVHGQSEGPWTVGRFMDSRKVHGQSEGSWTVGRSMDSRKVHGQSEGPWTVERSMDSRKVHGQSEGPWTVGRKLHDDFEIFTVKNSKMENNILLIDDDEKVLFSHIRAENKLTSSDTK